MKLKDVIFPKMPHNFMSWKNQALSTASEEDGQAFEFEGSQKNQRFWVFFRKKKGEAIMFF